MKRNLHILFVPLAFCLLSWQDNDAFTVKPAHPQDNPLEKIINSLLGGGIEVSNIKCNRGPESIVYGSFYDPNNTLGVQEGLIMTTGSIYNILGPNNTPAKSAHAGGGQRDVNLEALVMYRYPTYDVCTIEFDIVPDGDTLTFNYVFGSEEYDEYVGSRYNDVFGFFIKGPGITGVKNMARLPSSGSPVAINQVNNGKVAGYAEKTNSGNAAYYIRNTDNAAVQYDGYTTVLEIKQAVESGMTYRLKLAIADVGDSQLDSGVLIEAKSMKALHASLDVKNRNN